MNRMGYIVSIFDHRQASYKGYEFLNKNFKHVLRFIKPDILFVIKGQGLDPKEIKDFNGLTVNWWLDYNKRWGYFQSLYEVFDRMYLCENEQGYDWMPIGIDTEYHRPVAPTADIFKSDIAFAGTNHPKRTPRIREIVKGIPYEFALWGNGYHKANPYVRGNAVYDDNLMMVYSGAKLILNNHYIKGITPNMRAFEAPATGTAMLSDSGSGLEKCLNRGSEYIAYDSFREARYLIRKYIEEPEEREKIALAGLLRLQKDHRLETRIEEMLK